MKNVKGIEVPVEGRKNWKFNSIKKDNQMRERDGWVEEDNDRNMYSWLSPNPEGVHRKRIVRTGGEWLHRPYTSFESQVRRLSPWISCSMDLDGCKAWHKGKAINKTEVQLMVSRSSISPLGFYFWATMCMISLELLLIRFMPFRMNDSAI